MGDRTEDRCTQASSNNRGQSVGKESSQRCLISSKQTGLMRNWCLFCCVIANSGYPYRSTAVFSVTVFMVLHLKSDCGVRFQMWFISLVVWMVGTVHFFLSCRHQEYKKIGCQVPFVVPSDTYTSVPWQSKDALGWSLACFMGLPLHL